MNPGLRQKLRWATARLRATLIETARLRGEDPGHYPLCSALAAIEQPGTVMLPTSSD